MTNDPDDDDGIDGADNANEDAMNAIAGARAGPARDTDATESALYPFVVESKP